MLEELPPFVAGARNYKGYAEEYLTGTLQGPWYSANDYSIFILLNDYLNVTGNRAFLSEKINGKTVLDPRRHRHELAFTGATGQDIGRLRQAGQPAGVRADLRQRGAVVQRRQCLDDAPRSRIASDRRTRKAGGGVAG